MSKTAIWFVSLFIMPLLLAFVALKLGWLPSSTTNHGEFLRQEVRQLQSSKIQSGVLCISVQSHVMSNALCCLTVFLICIWHLASISRR